MKLLAIHSNVLFFRKAPNFYEWLAGERGLIERYKLLGGKYSQEKAKGPLLLKETYGLAIGGLTPVELKKYCEQYCQKYFVQENIAEVLQAMKEIQVLVFSSYPCELYEVIKNKGLAHKAFGTKGALDENGKIMTIASIRLDNVKLIEVEMEKIGFGEKFTLEPNRFGMLEYLIDEMIKSNLAKDDVAVLGKGDTAKPMHEVAEQIIESLSEL